MAHKHLWNGYGDSVLGWLLEAGAVVCYVCWVLPRAAWLRLTGRIPKS